MAAENEAGIEINGELHEVPTLDSLDMDEAQVLYDYSGLVIEDFVQVPGEEEEERQAREARFRNPGLMRALMHIAYQRANRDLKPAKVRELVGKANMLAAAASLAAGQVEDEESPLASTTEQEQLSQRSSVEPKTPSGSDSPTGSDQQDATLGPIGTGRSATSSLASLPTTLAS